MVVDPDRIPIQLKERPQWVNWRWEQRVNKLTGELKRTKPPYQPSGTHAESDNPKTWVSFAECLAAYQRGGFNGIGYVITKEDGLVGVDLDHCRDQETGIIAPWALSIVERLNSYSEISPSGTGLRIFIQAKLPPRDRKLGHFEVYDSGRYLTITGNHLEGNPYTIEERQNVLEAVHSEVFAERNQRRERQATLQRPLSVRLEDSELLERMWRAKNGNKIVSLYYGDITGYASHSEADLALCSHLSFWCGGDAACMDRLFRASDLFRPKWDERRGTQTYGELTIAKALSGTTATYTSPFPKCRTGVVYTIRVKVG